MKAGTIAANAVTRAALGVKDLLDVAGLSYDALASWRAGRRQPNEDSLERLANALEGHAREIEKQVGLLRKAIERGA